MGDVALIAPDNTSKTSLQRTIIIIFVHMCEVEVQGFDN